MHCCSLVLVNVKVEIYSIAKVINKNKAISNRTQTHKKIYNS